MPSKSTSSSAVPLCSTTHIIAAKPQPLRVGKTAWDVFRRLSAAQQLGGVAVVEHKGLSANRPRISSYPAPFEHMRCHPGKRPLAPLVIRAAGSACEEMPRYRRQVVGLISKLGWIGKRPNIKHCLDDITDGRALRHDQQPRAGLARRQVVAKTVDHRSPIMRHQDPALCCCTVQQHRIGNTVQASLLGRHEIHRRLAPPDGLDDSELEVVVSLEPDAQERRSPWAASAFARWILAQSVGFACSSGMAFPSNSRSVSPRYLSISAW